jgi:hypothetical protein
MRNKAVAIHATTLVFMITLFTFFTLILLLGWMKSQNVTTNQVTCTAKQWNFCIEWAKSEYKKEPDWNNIAPKDCEKDPIGIGKPSVDDCKALLLQPKY